jgi:hypothetical protein
VEGLGEAYEEWIGEYLRKRRLENKLIAMARPLLLPLVNFYSYNRPHASLGGQIPYERLREKAQLSV